MELRVLRYFLAVARSESISGAAEVLHVTQPTLSRQLMDLEKEVGKTLFLRGKRRITLTEEGVLLRKRAAEILDLVDKTAGELAFADETIAGDVYIGAGETHAVHYLTRAAKRLQMQYPDIRCHISSGDRVDVTEQLDRGLIDFGLLFGEIDTGKYSALALPTYDTWGIVLRRDDPLAQRESVTLADMRDKPLIVNRSSDEPGRLQGILVSPHVVATYSLAFNGSLMVEDGLGYMICLDKILNLSGDSCLCFRPFAPTVKASMSIVWKKYPVFSKPAAKFLDKLQAQILENSSKTDD